MSDTAPPQCAALLGSTPVTVAQGRPVRHPGRARRAMALILTCTAAALCATAFAVGNGGAASTDTTSTRVVQPRTGKAQPALRGSSWALPAVTTKGTKKPSPARGSSWA